MPFPHLFLVVQEVVLKVHLLVANSVLPKHPKVPLSKPRLVQVYPARFLPSQCSPTWIDDDSALSPMHDVGVDVDPTQELVLSLQLEHATLPPPNE